MIEKVKKLSRDRQEDAAEAREQIAQADDGAHVLSDEERRLARQGLAELDRGEVATAAAVRAVFDKYRR